MYSGMYDNCATAARQQWGSQGMYIPETTYFDGLEKLPDEIARRNAGPISFAQAVGATVGARSWSTP